MVRDDGLLPLLRGRTACPRTRRHAPRYLATPAFDDTESISAFGACGRRSATARRRTFDQIERVRGVHLCDTAAIYLASLQCRETFGVVEGEGAGGGRGAGSAATCSTRSNGYGFHRWIHRRRLPREPPIPRNIRRVRTHTRAWAGGAAREEICNARVTSRALRVRRCCADRGSLRARDARR